MRSLLLQGITIVVTLIAASAALLFGGFYLSRALLPHWPPDYHATAAIAIVAVGLIVAAAVAAHRSSRAS